MGKGRLFRIVCGVMIGIIVVVLIAVTVGDDDTSVDVSVDLSQPYADTTEWMSYLSDDLYISELSIPGTHNSAAEHVMLRYVMRCQNTDIKEQLENGYRYLDLRVALDEKTGQVKLVHNFVSCHTSSNPFSEYLYFDDVTAEIYSFLQQHSTETVIVNIKIEDGDHSISDIQAQLLSEIKSNKDYWYYENEIPTLKEARGRIVLATRFEDEAGTGITGLPMAWDEQDNKTPTDIPYELYVNDEFRYWVQDRYNYTVEDKYDAVVDGLENCEADDNTFFLNFVSTTGDGKIGHPYGYAKNLNSLLLEYQFKNNTSYGIIIVDFGTEDLARQVYYTNTF